MTDICTIYRSDSKQGLYLYLQKGKQMDDIPKDLLKKIGLYTEVMEIDLSKRKKLAQADIEKVKKNIIEKGYYIQLPKDFVKNVINYT